MPENNWEHRPSSSSSSTCPQRRNNNNNNNNSQDSSCSENNRRRAENWKLLWPSEDYMKEIQRNVLDKLHLHPSPSLPSLPPTTTSDTPLLNDPPALLSEFPQEILFFAPKTFALMEPDIQTQICEYSANRSFIKQQRVPHIKSYTRVYSTEQKHKKNHKPSDQEDNNEVDDDKKRKTKGVKEEKTDKKCSCYPIAWSWLTSACLSKGFFLILDNVKKVLTSLLFYVRSTRRGETLFHL
jgi:hypothetical protein